MKKLIIFVLIIAVLAAAAYWYFMKSGFIQTKPPSSVTHKPPEIKLQIETRETKDLGPVKIFFMPTGSAHVVLMLSGNDGWNEHLDRFATKLANSECTVIGIDTNKFLERLQTKIGYPAGDLESLSQSVQKTISVSSYITPVLVGFQTGGAIVYASLAEAPKTTFLGGISIDFCPNMHLTKPFYKGNDFDFKKARKPDEYQILSGKKLNSSWTVLQNSNFTDCKLSDVNRFASRVAHANFVQVASGNFDASFQKHFADMVSSQKKKASAVTASALMGLPLQEVPTSKAGDTMAVIVTGDGGCASIDRDIGNELASRGIAVVGLNSLQYFWKKQTPQSAGADLANIIRYYLAAWKKHHVILIGYSYGAEVLPYMATHLPAEVLARVKTVALLGPGLKADFEFKPTSWLNMSGEDALPVHPEIEKLKGTCVICIYSAKDAKDSACSGLDRKLFHAIPLPGGHHFEGNYRELAQMIQNTCK